MPADKAFIKGLVDNGRLLSAAVQDNEALGPLRWLPGRWENTDELKGHGFNLIALPFSKDPSSRKENGYRLLINQYKESLSFNIEDVGVPNRGVDPLTNAQADQTAVALSYTQIVTQIASDDAFLEDFAGNSSKVSRTGVNDKFNGQKIHHEPGLWLYMTNQNINSQANDELRVARMGSIPHGTSFLAVGTAQEQEWKELDEAAQRRLIPRINGIVVGGGSDPDERSLDPIVDPVTNKIRIDYFAPYRHFHQNPFKGTEEIPGFSGFDPVHATELLSQALAHTLKRIGSIKRVKRLHVDSTIDHAGINRVTNAGIGSTPFIARQADTTAMNATFIIYEIEDSRTGGMRYFLQYAQNVILDFIGRPDGHPGRARWPHVSINTLERVADASLSTAMKQSLSE